MTRPWALAVLVLASCDIHDESAPVIPPEPQKLYSLTDRTFATIEGPVGSDGAFATGQSVCLADVNADGRADIIVGAPGSDFDEIADRGSVYVIFGRAGTTPTTRDLASLSRFDIRFDGEAAGDALGGIVAGGDVDGDGIADILVSALGADPNGRADAGTVYVIRGSAVLAGGVRNVTDSAAIRLDGAAAGDALGSSMATTEDTGDGNRGILLGAPGADPNSRVASGAVYFIAGSLSSGTYDFASSSSWKARFEGATAGDALGQSVQWGALLTPEVLDVAIMGAPGADPSGRSGAGSAYVKLGDLAGLTGSRDLLNAGNWDLRYDGEAAGDALGTRVAIADVLEDVAAGDENLGETVLGAPGADPNGRADSGAVYVVRGVSPLVLGAFDLTTASNYHVRFEGSAAGDQLGRDFIVQDWDGSYTDLLMATRSADFAARADAGALYVRFGGLTIATGSADLSVAANYDILLGGAVAGDGLGWGIATGPIDGDGVVDLVVTAATASPSSRAGAGSAYVLLGSPSSGTKDMSNAASWSIRYDGAAQGGGLDARVSVMGDVTGDGIADVVAVSPNASPGGRPGSCAVYVIRGGVALTAATHELSSSLEYVWRFAGPANTTPTGVDIGDLNGDAVGDLAIAFADADFNGLDDSGSVYVVFGSTARPPGNYDLTLVADYGWRFDGAAAGDALGGGLHVGDVDGDGIADLLMGAAAADFNGRADSGSLYVVTGDDFRADGDYLLSNAANYRYRFDGAVAGDGFGAAPAASELNGDGIADLRVAAPNAGFNGRALSGTVYVLYDPSTLAPGIFDVSNSANYNLRFDGPTAGARMEHAAGTGDVNNDGYGDIVFGSSWTSGSFYTVHGGNTIPAGNYDLLNTANVSGRIDGATATEAISYLTVADVNADGLQDMVLTAPDWALYVLYGGLTSPVYGVVSLASVARWDRRLALAPDSADLSTSLRFADVTGDGLVDMVVADRIADGGISDSGLMYILAGPLP